MSLQRKIKLLHRSSNRMMNALGMKRDEVFWVFMRRELQIQLRRTIEAWWMVFRRKER